MQITNIIASSSLWDKMSLWSQLFIELAARLSAICWWYIQPLSKWYFLTEQFLFCKIHFLSFVCQICFNYWLCPLLISDPWPNDDRIIADGEYFLRGTNYQLQKYLNFCIMFYTICSSSTYWIVTLEIYTLKNWLSMITMILWCFAFLVSIQYSIFLAGVAFHQKSKKMPRKLFSAVRIGFWVAEWTIMLIPGIHWIPTQIYQIWENKEIITKVKWSNGWVEKLGIVNSPVMNLIHHLIHNFCLLL